MGDCRSSSGSGRRTRYRRWRRTRCGRLGPCGKLEHAGERPDGLDCAVFEHLEVGLGQILHRLPALVAHDDIHQHRPHAGFHCAGRPLRRLLLGRTSRHPDEDDERNAERKSQCGHFPPTDWAPLRSVRASRSSLVNSARSRAASSIRPARW